MKMAYRFSDTNKWQDEWFVELTSNQKLMFLYFCDNCDAAGFYELSLKKMAFDLSFDAGDVKGAIKGLERGYILSDDRKVILLKNFLKHQKNLLLNPGNKAHKGIISRIENYKHKFSVNILEQINAEILPLNQGASKPHLRGTGNGIGNILHTRENKGVDFLNFWNLYDRKIGDKNRVEKKWYELSSDTQNKIISMLPEWIKQFTDKQYQPYPETYLNQQRWNDEAVVATEKLPVDTKPASMPMFAPVQKIDHSNMTPPAR